MPYKLTAVPANAVIAGLVFAFAALLRGVFVESVMSWVTVLPVYLLKAAADLQTLRSVSRQTYSFMDFNKPLLCQSPTSPSDERSANGLPEKRAAIYFQRVF
jgi:hypothetical protein